MKYNIIFYFIFSLFSFFSCLKADDQEALKNLKKAEEEYVQQHIEQAALKSQEALYSLSKGSMITDDQHIAVINDVTTYSIEYAKLLANKRRFQQAREQLRLILRPEVNPGHQETVHLLHYLQAFHDDLPKNRDNDDTNETTRAHLLLEVETNEISPHHNNSTPSPAIADVKEVEVVKKSLLQAKLHHIILPVVQLEDVTLDEAVDYIKERSRDADPDHEGVNIVLKLSNSDLETEEKKSLSSPLSLQKNILHLNLELHEVPLEVALQYLAEQADLKLEVEPYAVSLIALSRSTETLLTQEYDLPSSFFPNKEESLSPLTVKNFFQSQGMEFPEGSSATYSPTFNKLVVRNRPENLELIATIIKTLRNAPPLQVSIETKFIEINQNDLSEFGFNWLLGSFALGKSGLNASGGGSATQLNRTAYPLPTEGMHPMGSLRAESRGIDDTSIETVMERGADSRNMEHSLPAVFSIGGIYNTPQFQMVVRALNQKKGIDMMAAPHVTTKNGAKATIKIVDEFIYPSQYSPPQLPLSTTNNSSSTLRQIPPTITPSFPSNWTSKNLGAILEVTPMITPDHKMISLELHPQITDFDGFINYGTPINAVGYSAVNNNIALIPVSETLTTNKINQPIFTVREVNTSVMVGDGQTVVLGGLIREDKQYVEEKIPFLGDIPLAGRLFRSKSERKIKKNLIIFVTPKILNADGAPYHN
jgi:general secretion pathway protein D